MKSLVAVLAKIQKELKAPKNQKNTFGNYNYRSCEDILEAVKPLIPAEYTLTIKDEMVQLGDRYYVKATASITNGESVIRTSAFAREAELKKGMDEAQITGSASSYARKYALNGLFLIDDTKDADTRDNSKIDIVDELKKKVDAIKSVEDLRDFYAKHRGYGADFDKYVVEKSASFNL